MAKIGVLAAALLSFILAAATAAPPPRAKAVEGGLVVLDNCDPVFRGKANYEDNLTLLDASGRQRFRVGGFNGAEGTGCNRRVAVDPARGALWAYHEVARRVRKFDLSGKELLKIEGVKINALAVDPDSGNLWTATSRGEIYGPKAVVYSKEGKLLAEHNAEGWDIAYDARGKSFWLAGKHLYKVGTTQLTPAAAGLLVKADVAGWCAASVAVNQKSGQVWVLTRRYSPGAHGGRDELLGFDNAGKPNVTVSLEYGYPKTGPFHASVDSKTGAVWVTMMLTEVRRFTGDGKPDGRFPFPAVAAQADEATGGAWVVTGEEVLLVSAKGEVRRKIPHKRRTSQVWVSAF